jgi:hypothetical protein
MKLQHLDKNAQRQKLKQGLLWALIRSSRLIKCVTRSVCRLSKALRLKTNNPPEFSIGDSDPTGEIDVAEAKKFLADVKAKAAKQGIKVKIYPLAEVLSPELYGDALASLGLKRNAY